MDNNISRVNAFGQLTNPTMATIGTAIPADPTYDPLNHFNATTGVDVSTVDYVPLTNFYAIEIRGGANGQGSETTPVYVAVQYANGSQSIEAFIIGKYGVGFLEGVFTKILKIGTTAALIFPYF